MMYVEEETESGGKVGELLIDDAVLAGRKGPWWTQLLRRSSAGGRRTGSRGAASDVGAVMMVRGGRFGMPAEWSAERPEADVVEALMESEKVRREEGVKLPSAELEECVDGMRRAVPRPRAWEGGGDRWSAFHNELDAADSFVAGLAGGGRPSEQAWEAARRVFSGFVSTPVGPDWATKERGVGATEGGAEEEGPMGVAAGEMVEHVKRASYVVWKATKEWRRGEEARVAAAAGRAAGVASARGWGEGDEVGSDVEEESDGEGEEDQERRQRRLQEEEDVESDDEVEAGDEVGERDGTGGAGGGSGDPGRGEAGGEGRVGGAGEQTGRREVHNWRIQVPPGCGSGRGQKAMGVQLGGAKYVIMAPVGTRAGDTIWVRLEGEKVRHLDERQSEEMDMAAGGGRAGRAAGGA